MRRRPRVEEVFVLNAVLALGGAAVWIVGRRALLLEYFYFAPLIALTHLVTLGFLSSLVMGVLYRLSPMLLAIEARSRKVAAFQLVLFLVGAWGMVAHFWMGELTGMSWSAILVWLSAVLQLANFRDLFRPSKKAPWARRFVASSLVHFFFAASLGVLLGLGKAYDFKPAFLAGGPLDNVFAHAHLAGAGFVTAIIFGFQLELVPTTAGNPSSLPYRFALFQVGTLGLALNFLAGWNVLPAALALAASCVWQVYGPARAFLTGRAKEWELLPLALLLVAAGLGLTLAFGFPETAAPARGRAQLAYGFLALFGFMTLTVVTVAFKLFPIWVWKERFRAEFGKRPVPGMKDLPSDHLRVLANLGVFGGSLGTAAAVLAASPRALAVSTPLLALGVLSFLLNLVRVVRWSLLDLEYRPTPADERKFREMFPGR